MKGTTNHRNNCVNLNIEQGFAAFIRTFIYPKWPLLWDGPFKPSIWCYWIYLECRGIRSCSASRPSTWPPHRSRRPGPASSSPGHAGRRTCHIRNGQAVRRTCRIRNNHAGRGTCRIRNVHAGRRTCRIRNVHAGRRTCGQWIGIAMLKHIFLLKCTSGPAEDFK